MDCVVQSWLYGTIANDLADVVLARRERGATAHATRLALESQFLGNRETRALLLDAQFRNFVQGDLSITDYCKRFKHMADALGDLGEVVSDRTLVLNVLRGLNEKYTTLGRQLRRARPFPTFLEVLDDLQLEELTASHQVTTPSTALLTGTNANSPLQPPSAPTQQPPNRSNDSSGGGCGGTKGGGAGSSSSSSKQRHSKCGGQGKGTSNDQGAGGPWPSFYNLWTGTISMFPGPRPPVPQPRPAAPQQALVAQQQQALQAQQQALFAHQ